MVSKDADARKEANKVLRKQIGHRLAELRSAKFDTQEMAFEALAAAGFKRGIDSYKSYEKGRSRIPVDEAQLALEVFGVPGALEYLYSGNEKYKRGGQSGDETSPSILLLPRLTAREAAEMPVAFERVSITAKRENRVDPVPTRSGFKIGPRAFLYAIEDDSMVPRSPFEPKRFEVGDDVLIDPSVKPRPGDFVFASLGAGSKGIFRQWEETDTDRADPEKYFVLKPLNTSFRTENVNPETNPGRVVGCMIQHISYRK